MKAEESGTVLLEPERGAVHHLRASEGVIRSGVFERNGQDVPNSLFFAAEVLFLSVFSICVHLRSSVDTRGCFEETRKQRTPGGAGRLEGCCSVVEPLT